MGPAPIHYLGPLIRARRGRPVRVKFVNQLPPGKEGDLFLPVDTTTRGAGAGPLGGDDLYPQNRASLHLHGGLAPWISGGSQYQWITPAGERSPYRSGPSLVNVPDMWFDGRADRCAKARPGPPTTRARARPPCTSPTTRAPASSTCTTTPSASRA